MPLIAPSLLSADFSNLIKDIQMVNNSQADLFHLDVMDGRHLSAQAAGPAPVWADPRNR